MKQKTDSYLESNHYDEEMGQALYLLPCKHLHEKYALVRYRVSLSTRYNAHRIKLPGFR